MLQLNSASLPFAPCALLVAISIGLLSGCSTDSMQIPGPLQDHGSATQKSEAGKPAQGPQGAAAAAAKGPTFGWAY